MKQWFPVTATNPSRASAGSAEGLAGRTYPTLIANRLSSDLEFRRKICKVLGRRTDEIVSAKAGDSLKRQVESVIQGQKTPSKTTLRICWRDGRFTNFIVKKSSPAQICLKKVESFIPEFEAQFQTRIPPLVKEALLLFVGRHPRQKEILDSVSVNFVGDEIRDLEHAYHNRLTLASMYGYNMEMADAMLGWFRANSTALIAYCFSQGAAKNSQEFAEYLWYHSSNDTDSDYEIIDLNRLIERVRRIPRTGLSQMVDVRDSARVGSTIGLPFGNLQYHEGSLQFRHDNKLITRLLKYNIAKKRHFGSRQKESGHQNELMIASALNNDKEFLSHFCKRVGHGAEEFVAAEASGKHAKKEDSVLGGKTPGKTDVSVLWKDGSRTNISVKKNPSGQVYLVTAKNFIDTYEAQYRVVVPSKVRRALAFFIGEDLESRSVLDATDIVVDGRKARDLAYKQNYRLMFAVIRNYDSRMAEELLSFLHDHLMDVFELCFSTGAVKDRSMWSNVLWYRNLVDTKFKGLNYLIPIPLVKAAIERRLQDLSVKPGKDPGSTINLPFGHLQYHQKQLEFYQKLKKIQELLITP